MGKLLNSIIDTIKSRKKINEIIPTIKSNMIHQENFNKVWDILLDLGDYRMEIQSLGDYKHRKIKEAEEDIEKILAEDPELLTYQNENGFNIGMLAAYHGVVKSLIVKSLQNPVAACQQDKNGKTIGMKCCESNLEDMVLLALDNKQASLLQDNYNFNIGHFAVIRSMKSATLKVLEYPELATQDCATPEMLEKDIHRNTIGLCATWFDKDPEVMDACKKCLEKHFKQNPIEEYDVDFNESDELEA